MRPAKDLEKDIKAFRARLQEHHDFLQKAAITTEDLLALAGLLEREWARSGRKSNRKR